MAKPIFFSLLLLVLCLIYEAYGHHHHTVKHIRLPSHKISRNTGACGSSSSSSSSSTTGAEENGAVADAAATSESTATSLSPSSSLRKSFSLNNSLGNGRNRGLGLNSKSLSGKYYGQQPNDMDSDDLNNEQIQNSMSSRFLNNKPVSGLYYKNNGIDRQNSMTSGVQNIKPLKGLYSNSNDNTLEDLRIGNRQNSITSGGLNSKSLTDMYSMHNQNDKTSDDPSFGKIQNIITSRVLNSKPQKGLYSDQNGNTSEDLSIGNRQNIISTGGLNGIPLNDRYSINNQNDKTLDDPRIGKRQNIITSGVLNSKLLKGLYSNQNDNTLEDLSIGNRQRSITSGGLNSKPLTDTYSIHNQDDKTLEDLSIGNRLNIITSGGLNSKPLNDPYSAQNGDTSEDPSIGNRQNIISTGGLNGKPLNDRYSINNQNDNTLEDPIIGNRLNIITSGGLNSKPLNDPYSINNQNDNTLEDPSIGKRQNSIVSDFQDFPNSTKTKIIPLAKFIVRQKTLSPSSNGDDSQQISLGNDNSSMMNIMNSIKKPLNEQNIVFKSFRKCCINGDCRMLKDGEECSIADYFKNMKTKQQPNNPMFTTSSNGDNGLNEMMSKFKSFDQGSFNSLGGDNMGDFQETGKPTNMRLGSMRYSTIIPSIGSSNGMGSYVMPQKIKSINYPHSDPIDLSEDEANEIRNQVLKKSNSYREKYNLEPFTLDDQLNNCAQDWANQMVKLQIFDHREYNIYGENLYSSLDFNNLGEKAVESWYNEITKFNIADDETELSSNVATHQMTQLLWKSSTQLGVGVSKNSNGKYYVVANYDPIGNVRGFFKENLPEIQQEDIEEVMESHDSQTESGQGSISWSSSSITPLQPGWHYEQYYN